MGYKVRNYKVRNYKVRNYIDRNYFRTTLSYNVQNDVLVFEKKIYLNVSS